MTFLITFDINCIKGTPYYITLAYHDISIESHKALVSSVLIHFVPSY